MANLDNGSDDRVIGGLEQPHGGKVLVVENLVQRIDLSAGNIEFVADCLPLLVRHRWPQALQQVIQCTDIAADVSPGADR